MNNLLDFDRQRFESFFKALDEKTQYATRTFQALHQYGIADFSAMPHLNRMLRKRLQDQACIQLPEVASEHRSQDGTIKWLIRLYDGSSIETVFIPEKSRGTLCVSSQVGCALKCRFCATGEQGFKRNLSVAEIIGQVWIAVRALSKANRHDRTISNIVMMGMGEPLLNFENVVTAMNIMMDDFGYGFSKYRVTLSTAGVVPMMKSLSEASPVSLAVSLHAPNDTLRNQLVPINKKYSLTQLMAACKAYYQKDPRRRIVMEYVMLADINDTQDHAHELVALLKGMPVKINLIPFNPYPGAHYQCSSQEQIKQFRGILASAGLLVTIRKTRGDDIAAACGQLIGEVV